MSTPKKLAIRLAAYGVLMGYLCLDLFLFKGPLNRTLTGPGMDSEEAIAEAKAMGIAARVYFQPIYRAQVDERAGQYLWERGRSFADTSAGERRLLREAIVNELVDELLLKIQIKVSPVEEYDIPEGTQEEMFALFEKRYGGAEAFEALIFDQRWEGKEEAKMRLNARLQREKYLNSILPKEVTEEHARKWFDENQKKMVAPARRQVRQIFISTLASDSSEEILKGAQGRIVEKKEDFFAVANSIKESSSLKDLGWVTAARLPQDLALSVFSLPLKSPQIIQSKLGSHLIEVTAEEPEKVPSYEEVSASVIEAIRQSRKEGHFRIFRRYMRSRAEGKIEVFKDVLFAEDLE
ncbi:peptidyl-prolyl cis-trans isomerase [Akkermansiaceae bacterium]|nr:peptidyl-prolyl cis-trans isomerase [Akkermansiaceae bacterium]MDB4629955.1 peptidyl-prolyl cis-trans isomerase [Akkermansiaceae bacterium]MDB4681468.1 peptidyl-prolyl cis-trans isomerase [Akkermansiaceae bacterium]